MPTTKIITFKPTIFSKEHKLVLDPEFIELYKSPDDNNPVKFSKLEIDAFRYEVKWLEGYKVTFGRINRVDVRSATGVIIKIRLVSVYKVGVKRLHAKYSDIVNTVVNYYAPDIINNYLRLFNNKQPFSILNVHFDQTGIQLKDKNNIQWSDVDLRLHARYVGISSKSKSDIYQGFDKWEDWNSNILYNVIRVILKNKNLLNN